MKESDPNLATRLRRQYQAQLAGPITGWPDFNRPVFDEATEKITKLGYRVWNPNDPDEPWPPEKQPRSFWMKRSIQELYFSDLLVLLPGWSRSEGVKAELAVARQFGIPVVYWSEHPLAYRCEWRR